MKTDLTTKRLDKVIAELEAVLHEELRGNEMMLDLLARKQQALRKADRKAVRQLAGEEHTRIQLLAETAKRRMAIAGQVTLLLAPGSAEPMQLQELAERIAEPARGRLLVLRHELRERMQEVRDQSQIVRSAMQSLVSHMQGLMQTIGGSVSRSPTYTRKGMLPKPAVVLSTFSASA